MSQDCQLSEWQNVGNCSKPCDTGVQQQNRSITIQSNLEKHGPIEASHVIHNHVLANTSNTNANTSNNTPNTSNTNANNSNNTPNTSNTNANNLTNTGNIEPFVSTTQNKYGCAIINDKIVSLKYVFILRLT